MAHSNDHHPVPVPNRTAATARDVKPLGPWKPKTEAEVANMKRFIVLMERMITDFERTAENLDRYILIEEERANTPDLANFTYLTHVKALALRRDNLKRSADVLTAQLAEAKEELCSIA
jgi:hypothetical protein